MAVLPSSSFSRDGSCRPGTCTRMRSAPWRWIDGSTVPSSLTRRSTIWIDCSTDWRMRSTMAGSVGVRRITPLPASRHLERALAGGAEDAAERLRQLAQLGQRRSVSTPSRTRNSTVLPRIDAAPDCRAASRSTRRTSSRKRLELLLADRVGVDFEQDVRAALQVEAEHEVALRPFRPRTAPSSRGRSSAWRRGRRTSAVSRIAVAFQREK